MTSNDVTQVVDHFAKEIGHQLQAVAPQADAVLVQVKQINSVTQLWMDGSALVFFGLVALIAWVWFRKNMKSYQTPRYDTETDYHGNMRNTTRYYERPEYIAPMAVTGIVGAIATVIALSSLFALWDQWLWIGALHPQIAVYHDIITKALEN